MQLPSVKITESRDYPVALCVKTSGATDGLLRLTTNKQRVYELGREFLRANTIVHGRNGGGNSHGVAMQIRW